jgi:hypothetical protein
MSEDAQRFRKRAADCRRLAATARSDFDRQTLEEMAVELDAEADKIESDEATL